VRIKEGNSKLGL